MSEIKNINLLLPNKLSEPSGSKSTEKSDLSFSDVLKKSIEQVNDAQLQADAAIKKAMSGETDIHDTMIAIQKADVSLKLMMEVRNKLLEAYQDIMRTQV
ncbi:flagellar hook-basal body complex protein FliE [Calditerrivibrio nitroreducens]|uniref:Flagellar hook-basal body complex protein FliE n=1 Tax=Calditerrivibrio nitroreducens (strain DSM 19672 / NBRC 101217 / Yu37-1) TaxID=768670 RepID=E4TGA6_CALNY|nr:flagellar hook-basal body complex protein FliE [Calditerrivibrio nitroreducens]ADR19693.1 flagellar hook-basal body complex subunit FliE [Calditerrivibrio nitroreducens DSM 19672]